MTSLLDLYGCPKKHYLLAEKFYYADKRVCFRTFLCICAFVMCILVLLHFTNVENPVAVGTSQIRALIASDDQEDGKPFPIPENAISIKEIAASHDATDVGTSPFPEVFPNGRPALHGLGTTFVRGSMGMTEVVVAHVAENTSERELKLFFRTFYRSGLAAKADMVLIFPSDALPPSMENAIYEEAAQFFKLLTQTRHNASSENGDEESKFSAFNSSNYGKTLRKNKSIWGRFSHERNQFDLEVELDASLGEFAFGSVVGFSVADVNPENTFESFIDNPPLELRRWACYELLLGMVKHDFTHVLLTGVSGILILGDPLVMARKDLGLFLSLEDVPWGLSSGLSDDGEKGIGRSFEDMEELKQSNLDGTKDDKRGHIRDATSALRAPMIHPFFSQVLRARKHSMQDVRELQVENADAIHGESTSRPKNGVVPHYTLKKKMKWMHKRVSKIYKRRKARVHVDGGLYEMVYGRVMWNALEDAEKTRKLVNSGAIGGGIHHALELANAMVMEIVKVATLRRSREAFPDNVLLSHLVHKRRKVAEGHLQLVDNCESFVHSLARCHESDLLSRRGSRCPYSMISEGQSKSRLWNCVMDLIHHDICMSVRNASVYSDCL